MFKKLLSNLPFNPGLLNQVAFYSRRLNRETAVRRLGFGLILAALLVNVFAVGVIKPQGTLAESSNDIIRGGFKTRLEAVAWCRDTRKDIGKILKYYGVTCDKLAKATTVYIKSTDYNKELDSLGRNPQGDYIQRTGKPTQQYTVNISGVHPLYMKNLWAWDSGRYSTYKVLKTTDSYGKPIFMMFDCGNIVTIKKYIPPKVTTPPPPTDVCPKTKGLQTNKTQCDVCPNRTGIQYTLDQCDACPNIPGTQNSSNDCYPCPEARDNTESTACLNFDKHARNETANIPDANNTMAHQNDVIEYTLSVKNIGVITFKDFTMEENMADVMEYADIIDMDGGQLVDEHYVVWPAQDIVANQTMTKHITVKVKADIRQIPASTSDPGSYDLVMTNVFYGKSVDIELPPAVHKRVELTSKKLPDTGPGTTLAVGFGMAVVVGYFFARSRTMSEEIEIIKDEFVGAAS